jgi:hypothetical protein
VFKYAETSKILIINKTLRNLFCKMTIPWTILMLLWEHPT